MSGSTEHLPTISQSQAQKEATQNAINAALSPAALFGRDPRTTAALTWGAIGGVMLVAGVPTIIGNQTVALTASTTNYVYATSAGVLTNTTSIPAGWPAITSPVGAVALYAVVTGTATVTTYIDYRASSSVSGGGGGGTPGGSDSHVQYNNSSAFGGDSRFTFDDTNKIVTGQYAVDSNAINAQTGTTYTLVAADNGKVITLSNVSAITLSIPMGLAAGFSCILIQIGTGQVTVATSGSPSVALNSYGGLRTISGQHAAASLISYVANVFNLSGNLG